MSLPRPPNGLVRRIFVRTYATEAQGYRIDQRSVLESFGSSPAKRPRTEAAVYGPGGDRLPPLGWTPSRGRTAPVASEVTDDARFGRLEPQLQSDLNGIIRSFRAPIRYAFAYGSGVFRQAGYKPEDRPLLDFIFAVSNPVHWHAINLQQHKAHYSLLARMAGSRAISVIQENMGAHAWFNVEAEVNGKSIKYGVISVEALCRDLLDWDTLYLSGRMHKPIRVLRDDARIRLADQVNLTNAIRTALLLLPETFTEEQLYSIIAGISYRGDFRMYVGENPTKVSNIVSAQYERFQTLYGPLLVAFKNQGTLDLKSSQLLVQDTSPKARAGLARRLPTGLKDKIQGIFERNSNLRAAQARSRGEEITRPATQADELATWTSTVQEPNFNEVLQRSLELIVAGPAFYQSLKGLVTVGPLKGLRYVGPKLRKKWLTPKPPPLPAVEPTEDGEKKVLKGSN